MFVKNLELPSENICQNLTLKRFWIFHGEKYPENLLLLLLKNNHTRRFYQSFFLIRKKPSPKTKSLKSLWTLNILKFSRIGESRASLDQSSVSHTSTSSILRKIFPNRFSVFYLVLTQTGWNWKFSKNLTDPKYHRIEERRMQLESW